MLVTGILPTHGPSLAAELAVQEPGPLCWVGRWFVDGNVAYVSDEKGAWEQGLLASLQVSES